jgi:hypothetical protein
MVKPTNAQTRVPPQRADGGEGVDLTSNQESKSPRMPHERDEKTGMTGGAKSARVEQGARDIKKGMQDTSRAPEADAAYKKQKK